MKLVKKITTITTIVSTSIASLLLILLLFKVKLLGSANTNVILTFAIFISFWTSAWNDHYTVLLYLPSYPTVAAGLFRYKEVAAFTLDIPTYFAGIIIGAIPTTIIFIIFSDTIMKNLTIGGLKG